MSFTSPCLVAAMVVFSSAVPGAKLESLASWSALGDADTVQCSVI